MLIGQVLIVVDELIDYLIKNDLIIIIIFIFHFLIRGPRWVKIKIKRKKMIIGRLVVFKTLRKTNQKKQTLTLDTDQVPHIFRQKTLRLQERVSILSLFTRVQMTSYRFLEGFEMQFYQYKFFRNFRRESYHIEG